MATAEPQTNGNAASPNFKSFDHLKTYPIVESSINTFQSYPQAQRIIELSTSAYSKVIGPLSPYLSKAYPYVYKADEFADGNLSMIEERFPVVKEPTDSLLTRANDLVGYPRKLAGEVIVRGSDFAKEKKEYVFKVYEDEFSKLGDAQKNGGYIPMAKAGVTTCLVVSSEAMGMIANYLATKKGESKETVADGVNNAKK